MELTMNFYWCLLCNSPKETPASGNLKAADWKKIEAIKVQGGLLLLLTFF